MKLWIVSLILGPSLFAAVRDLTVDDSAMAEIRLQMGRSTVLHFSEKPVKIIAGNQNYFNIEFTGNDVTIQPLGYVTSNLFVYGEFRRYGFVLKVGGGGYDDLVRVHFRGSRVLLRPEMPLDARESSIVSESETLKVELNQVVYDKDRHLFVVELALTDTKGAILKSKSVTATVFQNGKRLPIREVTFDKEEASPKDATLKARIFISLSDKSEVVIKIVCGKSNNKITIPGVLF